MMNLSKKNIGEFREADHGHWFTYRLTEDEWAIKNGLLHEIDVGTYMLGIECGWRYGVVKKTVAYICVAEDCYGKPVNEKWKIGSHKVYP